MPRPIEVTQIEGAEVPVKVLADSIVAIAAAMKRLRSGKLNDKALFLLVQQAAPTTSAGSRIPISTIKDVFDGISSLEQQYIRKPALRGGR